MKVISLLIFLSLSASALAKNTQKPETKAPTTKAVKARKAAPAKPSLPPKALAAKPAKATKEPAKKNSIRGFSGDISFSEQEISLHKKYLPQFLKAAASCATAYLDNQNQFFRKYGISRYFGYESDWNKKFTKEQKAAYFAKYKIPLDALAKQSPVSCINLTLDCMQVSFLSTEQPSAWAKIKAFTLANGQSGLALQLALQRLGWKIAYFNPYTDRVIEWDKEEMAADPKNTVKFWGWHEYRLHQVRKEKKYLFNPVDDTTSLVDFGTKLPASFLKVPFYVGTVHSGFHVFMGKGGFVVEAHNRKSITDPGNVEGGPFDPMGVNRGWFSREKPHPNGDQYGIYKTGLMAIPPGY